MDWEKTSNAFTRTVISYLKDMAPFHLLNGQQDSYVLAVDFLIPDVWGTAKTIDYELVARIRAEEQVRVLRATVSADIKKLKAGPAGWQAAAMAVAQQLLSNAKQMVHYYEVPVEFIQLPQGSQWQAKPNAKREWLVYTD